MKNPTDELIKRYDEQLAAKDKEIEHLKEQLRKADICINGINSFSGELARALKGEPVGEFAKDKYVIQEIIKLVENTKKFSELKAGNATLRERLKPVQEIHKKYGHNEEYIENHSQGIYKEMWQAICKTMEGK